MYMYVYIVHCSCAVFISSVARCIKCMSCFHIMCIILVCVVVCSVCGGGGESVGMGG